MDDISCNVCNIAFLSVAALVFFVYGGVRLLVGLVEMSVLRISPFVYSEPMTHVRIASIHFLHGAGWFLLARLVG